MADTPTVITEIEILALARRIEEVGLDELQRRQLVGTKILSTALEQHLLDRLLAVHLGKREQIVTSIRVLDIPNERIVHLDETVVTIIRYTITAKASILQEITSIDIRIDDIRTYIAIAALNLYLVPELLVIIEGLSQLKIPIRTEFPTMAAIGELRKLHQLILVKTGKRCRRIQPPNLLKLMVRPGSYLEEFYILSLHLLLVDGMVEVLQESILFALQRMGEQVINTLVALMSYRMANVYLHIQVLIAQRTHILLVVTGRKEETARALLYRDIDFNLLTQIIPIRVHQEDHLLDLQVADDTYQVFRKSTVKT